MNENDLKNQDTEISAYRKALREIRLQAGFPDNINWPSKPQ
jgi:hypothetical protein